MTERRAMSEMTNRDVAEFLARGGDTVLVPIGTTEQHGAHGPLGTDWLIPLEICNRIAPTVNALVAPSLPYGLSVTHKGAPGLIYVRIEAYVAFMKDITRSLGEAGFRRIVFVNGHYDNAAAVMYALRSMYEELPQGTLAYALNYWDCFPAEVASEYLGWDAGLHANVGETAAVMAIDADLIDLEHAEASWPEPPDGLRSDLLATTLAAVVPIPGSMLRVTKTGGWGNPLDATPEMGEHFLQAAAEGVAQFIQDVEKVYEKMWPAGQR